MRAWCEDGVRKERVSRRWGRRPATVGCLESPGSGRREAGAGAGQGLSLLQAVGASRRWPFDLTTNSLFSISETGLAPGSQGGEVARQGIVPRSQGREVAQRLPLHPQGAGFQQPLEGPLAGDSPDRPQGRLGGCGTWLLCLPLQDLGLGQVPRMGQLEGRREGQLRCAQT